MNYSPLRYPGGKSRIAPMVQELIKNISPKISTYHEPFCGGAGIALYLLINNLVTYIEINDFDCAIYAFWRAVFSDTNELISMIKRTPITIDEWKKQKNIYVNATKYSVQYAFATLFLNRTNRSGILSAGPIGGYRQEGLWKLNARFNKSEIIKRIVNISKYKNRVIVNNMDIRQYIAMHHFNKNDFIYFDPPYINKANRLYKNSLVKKDHIEIAEAIKNINNAKWIITYDDTEIVRSIYSEYYISQFSIQYSAATKKKEKELLILKDSLMKKNIQKYLL